MQLDCWVAEGVSGRFVRAGSCRAEVGIATESLLNVAGTFAETVRVGTGTLNIASCPNMLLEKNPRHSTHRNLMKRSSEIRISHSPCGALQLTNRANRVRTLVRAKKECWK